MVMELTELNAWQVIFKQGDAGDSYYLIFSGEVGMYHEEEEAGSQPSSPLDDGSSFGDSSFGGSGSLRLGDTSIKEVPPAFFAAFPFGSLARN